MSAPSAAVSAPASASTAATPTNVPSTINIALGAAPTGFDPFNDLVGPVDQFALLYGGQLMSLTADGQPGVFQLAHSLTESADRKSWIAKLRSGLKYSDGTPLKASDVAASLKYAAASAGPTGKFVLYDTVSSIDTPNDTTVVFNVKQPTSLIPYLLADPGSTIWPASGLAKGKSFFQKPTSAGRYKIDSFDAVSGRVELSANTQYYGTKPKVQKLVYTVVPDDATRLAQLKSGTVDFAEDFASSLKSQMTGSVQPQTTIAPGYAKWFVFSDASPITGNKNVRQAINLAINRQQILDVAATGVGTVLNGLPWDQPNLRASQTPIKQDVAKAKSLLAGTPCANGCTTKVVSPVTTNAPTDKIGLVMQQQLKVIGINLQIAATPSAQVVATIKKPDFDAYNSTASVGNPAPITIGLEEADPAADIFTSYELKYSSPKMHSLVQQLLTAKQPDVEGVVAKINAQFEKDLPWLALIATPTLCGSRLQTSVISIGLDGKVTIACRRTQRLRRPASRIA